MAPMRRVKVWLSVLLVALAGCGSSASPPTYTDAATHVSVTVLATRGVLSYQLGKQIRLELTNRGTRPQPYSYRDFAGNGRAPDAIQQVSGGAANRVLTHGVLKPGATVVGWIWLSEVRPHLSHTLIVTWRDGGRLKPPAVLARYTVH